MPIEEDDFKRGGVEKVGKKRKIENDLFKVGGSDGGKTKKKKVFTTKEERLAKKKAKIRAEKNQEQIFKPNVERASLLSAKILTQGMLVYGMIKDIRDYEMDVSLPNGLTGFLPITNISRSYTELLQKLTEDGETTIDEEVFGLSELFRVGQPVRCKVVDGGSEKKPKLTINPKEVNENLTIENLQQNVTVCGAVSSVEDRGYVIDLGINSVKAFLTAADVQSCAQDRFIGELQVGSNVHCTIKSDKQLKKTDQETRSINVVINPREIFRNEIKKGSKVTMQSLQPGMMFQVNVTKVNEEGVTVRFLGYSANIHRSQLEKSQDKYEVGTQFKATVLFVHPTTKIVSMSALAHLLTPDMAPKRPFGDLSVGTIVEEAEALKIEGKRGVVFKLSGKIQGFAYKKQLADGEVNNVGQIFKKKTIHRCRVMDFNYVDNLAIVTLKESILSRPFLKYSDIEPGMVVEGTVKNIVTGGVSVMLGQHIYGFIPSIHLADIPLKHPERFFESGGKVRCKVVVVDPIKKRLILTAKKSLINTKLPTITSYNDCQRGMLLEGFIGDVKSHGVLVIFYNNVKGWVPLAELSAEIIDYPQKVFFRGQVVKCQVLTTNPEQDKMVLSFKLSGKTPFGTQTRELPASYAVGKIFKGKIMKKTENGCDVQDTKSEAKVFIPKYHLSDHQSNWDLIPDIYHEGEIINNIVYLSTNGNVIIASRRPSVLKQAKSKGFITDFSDLKPGLLLAGSVRRVMDYGVFVDLGGGLVGLAPNQYLCDQRLPNPRSAFAQGKAVVAKVTEVDDERKRFLVSLRMMDCYHNDTRMGIELLADYFQEDRVIRKILAKREGIQQTFDNHKVGELVNATIGNVNDIGVTCTLEDGVKGIATSEHLGGATCEVGKTLQGVVLHVDLQAACLEMSFDTKLVAAVKNFNDSKFSKAQKEQVMKSEVHLIKEDFVLVSLKGHCAGRFAYLPAKRHLNDILERHQYIIGQVNTIVIKKVEDSLILASLQLHENVAEAEKRETRDGKRGHHVVYKPGAIVDEAIVTNVHEFQLNVSLNGTPGRVHITEIDDVPQEGCNPLRRFHAEQKIKVKVIGTREVNSKSKRTAKGKSPLKIHFPECTLKESILKSGETSKGETLDERKYDVGEQVHFFVTGFHGQFIQGTISAKTSAKVHVLNCSTDESIVRDPSKKFHRACSYIGHITAVRGGFVEVSFLGSKSKIEQGSIVQGYVVSKSPGLGLKIKLASGVIARVALCDMSDVYEDLPTEKYSEGQCVRCFVLQNGDTIKSTSLSLRNSRLSNLKGQLKVRDKEIKAKDSLKEGKMLRGFVTNTSKKGIFVSLSREISGRVALENSSEFVIKNPEKVFYPGRVVTVKVISIDEESGQISLSTLERDTHVAHDMEKEQICRKRPRKDSDSNETKRKKKRKGSHVKDVEEREETDEEVEVVDSSGSNPMARLSLGTEFCWDEDFKLPSESDKHQVSDSDSGDDSDDDLKKSKPKRSRQEKKRMQQEEERKLAQREKMLLDSSRAPEAADDFDRLVLQSPNSSIVWMRYMAFYLETAEVEKAKAVAERAFRTISFREEQEKLNVWVAYLNLENMYGTHESLTEVFERAIKHNDPLKIHQQLITIYIHSGKIEAAEQLHNTVVKRFSLNKDVWINFGQFYFHNNKIDQARKLMQRSLKSLDRKNHVEVLSKFAQLEYKMGEPERGKTMFESILSSYPKRTDLWSIYIDMTIKQADLSDVRQLFERVIHMNFSAKKMKFFFKKYLDFEEKFGTEEDVSVVKQKAVEYVQSKSEVL